MLQVVCGNDFDMRAICSLRRQPNSWLAWPFGLSFTVIITLRGS